ncbi:MAG: hypothetical protein ACE5HS_07440 [bacterium]
MSAKYSIKRWQYLLIPLALLLMTPSNSTAQSQGAINWDRMQRDLDIMEGVLDKLLNSSPYDFELAMANGKTLGTFFKGYGVVFQINYSSFNYAAIVDVKTSIELEMQQLKQLQKQIEPSELRIIEESQLNKQSSNMAERVNNLKDQLTEFLGDYADAIGQLRDSHRVTVLVNFGKNRSVLTYRSRQKPKKEKAISMLEVTVKKSDIVAYRQGRINEAAFRKRIVFRERTQNEKMRKNIDIMANIMNTALHKKYHKNFSSDGKTHGIYLEGLGVLFFMNGKIDWNNRRILLESYIENYQKGHEVQITRKKRERESKKKFRETIDAYKDAVIEVVGNYGHTLRTLKPTENVIVAVHIGDYLSYSDDFPNRFIVKINKSDLDKYNRGKIKFASFKKKVEFIEY